MKPDATVEIEMLPTANGGRAGATPPNQFGCVFELGGEYYDCRLDLTSSGPLIPGQSANVPLAFLFPEKVVPRLMEGAQFHLWEGHTIATGHVKSVIKHE